MSCRRAGGAKALLCALIVATFLVVGAGGTYGSEGEEEGIANTTVKIQVDDETSPGGYFPSFVVEERSNWPRETWPRGEGWSRGVLAKLAREEMNGGALVILFRGSFCPECQGILDLMERLGVVASSVDYDALGAQPGRGGEGAGGGQNGRDDDGNDWVSVGEMVKNALYSMDVSNAEPFVFVGTRFLGNSEDVHQMFLTGELSARLEMMGLVPRIQPPINRAPIAIIQPRSTISEAKERDSVPFTSTWVHPVVYGRVHISVVEAQNLVANSYTYDPIQQLLVRGSVPTVGFPVGTPESNVFAQIDLEGERLRTSIVPRVLDPVWNQNFTVFPVKDARSFITVTLNHVDDVNSDPFLAEDAPVFLGRVVVGLDLSEKEVDRWYDLTGIVPGSRVQGRVRVAVRYEAVNYLRVQSGRSMRIGGILLQDADARNNSMRLSLSAQYGNLTLPTNRRVAYLRGDPLVFEDVSLVATKRLSRYGFFAEPVNRFGFRVGDGLSNREIVVEGLLDDLLAVVSELEYDAPYYGVEDVITVDINDLGHTGTGGAKTGRAQISVTVFEGTDNVPPSFRMWPEGRGLPFLPESGSNVTRVVPMGLEANLHGLQIDDHDAYDGALRVCAVAEFGLMSLRGMGPWNRGDAAERAWYDDVKEAESLAVEGRQISLAFDKGIVKRDVVCVQPGGFADEYYVEGPIDDHYFVHRRTLAGTTIPGTLSFIRETSIPLGGALPNPYDAQTDFEVQYWVRASHPVNVYVMNEANYARFVTKAPFTFELGPTLLDQVNATLAPYVITVTSPTRWYVVIEQAFDTNKPLYRGQTGALDGRRWPDSQANFEFRRQPGEFQTGFNGSVVTVQYDIRIQRVKYREDHFKEMTGEATLDKPNVKQLCTWLLGDKDHDPPPGLLSRQLMFTVGDGHRDSSMCVSGTLTALQMALGTLSYVRFPIQGNASSNAMSDTVRLVADDLGHTGSGGRKTASFEIKVMSIEQAAKGGVDDDLDGLVDYLDQPRGDGPNATNGTVAFSVDDSSAWLDYSFVPLDIGGNWHDPLLPVGPRFGKEYPVRSLRVPSGRYTAVSLATALTSALAESVDDFFWNCWGARLDVQMMRGTSGICDNLIKSQPPDGPMAIQGGGGGGALVVSADEAEMKFRFEYDATTVWNGHYTNGFPCDYGGGPGGQNKTCGWWAGKFRLLFETGPNRDRSIARIMGFDQRQNYESSVSQHKGGSYGDMNPTRDAYNHPSLRGDNDDPALLVAPYTYYSYFIPQVPSQLIPTGTNRPPTITVPFKSRPDYVSVAVPPNSMKGRSHVRDTGVSFVMAGIGDELDVNTGIGTILNRFYVLEPGDASVRDYAFLRPHVPDPAKAEVTYQWDYSVLVTGLEIIMTTHGIVEVEGFVGGLASPEAGQYDDAESNYGWTSIGISAGSAGSGPYADGTTSIFAWPDNEISGVFFRFVVTNTSHQKKWALYRAFPIYSSRTREVHGMEVPPRFASVYAGVENWLHGIRIDDVDIGEDAVQAYSEDVRKLRVTVECERGELFVSAPYTDVVDATFDGHPAGRSQLIEGETVRDNIAGANAGDVQFGTSASVPMGSNLRNMLGAGNIRQMARMYARPDAPGSGSNNLHKIRGADSGTIHFVEGGGTADRKMVFEGRLSQVRQALAGLRYKSITREDPGRDENGKVCTGGKMCGQSSASIRADLGGYGGTGFDSIVILVDDMGNSDRVCDGGGADPLANCYLVPGTPRVATAVIELAVKPRETNEFGQRARSVDERQACNQCYIQHPMDKDMCIHVELFFVLPDGPGHSYSRKALDAYTQAQRAVWEAEFRKPCTGFYRMQWQDTLGGDVKLGDRSNGLLLDGREFPEKGFMADSKSHAHGDATPGTPLDDDVRRFLEAQQQGSNRPWEGR